MAVPDYVGRYVVRREIARGAFATVTLAWDEELESQVAIKILDCGADDRGADFQARFIEEARLLRRIRSHSVIGVHDVGRLPDGRPYIVMDFADLGTLTRKVAEAAVQGRDGPMRGLDLDCTMALVDAMADGLAAIHRAGVVHRDIKPDNILFQSMGNPSPRPGGHPGCGPSDARAERIMIADLGIAKDLAKRHDTMTLIGGTPAFRAPEQLDREAQVTPAADVFAAAAVLWYAVAGEPPPPPGETEAALDRLPEAWRPLMREALAPVPQDRIETIDSFRAAAHDAMARLAASRPTEVLGTEAARSGPGANDAACPYLGLGAFQPEDSGKFFGRETMVESLLQRMRAQRVLVIGGPSGSGKSSLIRAGLVASLRDGAIPGSEHWRIDVFTPGRDALSELFFRLRGGSTEAGAASIGLDDFLARPTLARQVAAECGRAAGRVLVVDQFEELFTLNGPGQRQGFIDALAAITDPSDSVFRIVLAIRADFYAACAALPWLAEAITHNQVLVGPMSAPELRRAIVEPARAAGYYLERNLVDAIVDDAGGEAGSLPLISHALVETWARRKGSTLTLEGYRGTGGVAGAIRQTADRVFDERFDDTERATARRLLLNLVTPGEGTSDSRRILDRAELDRAQDADTLRRVIERLTEARLLTVDDRRVQIAHEALLRSWPRLREWIDESRADLRVRVRLVQLAEDWIAGDRDPDLLLRGGRLVFALEWLEKNAETAGALERDFLDASVEARDRAEAAAAAGEARARRRRAVAIGALSLLAAGATAASIVAFTESRRARLNEGIAQDATAVATERFASALGAVSLGLVTEDPLLALELAAQSMGQAASPAATFDARAALVAARRVLAAGSPVPLGSAVAAGDAHSLALSADGAFAALGRRDGTVAMLDARSRQPVGDQVEAGIGGIEDLVFTPDGTSLVAVGTSGQLVRWPVAEGSLGTPMPIGTAADVLWGAAIDPGGDVVASVGEEGAIRLWDLQGGETAQSPLAHRSGDFTSVAFSPDGEAILAGAGSGEIFAWRYPAGGPVFPPITEAHSSDVWQLAFSPEGDLFATASSDGTSALASFPGGELLGTAFEPGDHVAALAFAPGGGTLYGGTSGGRLAVWDVAAGRAAGASPPGHQGAVLDLAASSDGSGAASLGADQLVRFWRLDSAPPLAITHRVPGARAKSVALGADLVATGDDSGAVTLRDAAGTAPPRVFHGHEDAVWAVALSPDGSLLASADRSGQVRLRETASGAEVAHLAAAPDAIWSLAFLPDGKGLLSASDTTLRLWDLDTGAERRSFGPFAGAITRAAVSSDGSRIAAALTSGQVAIWDTATESAPMRLMVDDDVIWTVAFSPNGRYLVAGSSDEVVSVWATDTGARMSEFAGHAGGVTDAIVLDDNVTIVAADRRGGLHVWDLQSGRRIADLPGAHGATIWRLARHPDGTRFASAGDDGAVRLWDILSVPRACALARGSFDAARRTRYLGESDAPDVCDTIAK